MVEIHEIEDQSSQSSQYNLRSTPSQSLITTPNKYLLQGPGSKNPRKKGKPPASKSTTPKDSPQKTQKPPKATTGRDRTKAHKKQFQYRSNLRPLYLLIKDKVFSNQQILELKKTPFWLLFDAFISKKVSFEKIKKNDWTMCEILKTYSNKNFKIGGQRLDVTDGEISLLFGISCGSKALSKLTYTKKMNSEFIDRHFKDDKSLTKPLLEERFREAFNGRTIMDFQDVARLLTLYVCCTLFFSNKGHSLKWGFVGYVEDLENIKGYDWTAAIRQTLMSSLKAFPTERVSGFVLLLPVSIIISYFPMSNCIRCN